MYINHFSFEYGPNIDDDGHFTKSQPFGKIIHNGVTGHHGNHRLKRALKSNTCQMYLVADTHFFNAIGNNNVDDTIIFMVSIAVCEIQLSLWVMYMIYQKHLPQ